MLCNRRGCNNGGLRPRCGQLAALAFFWKRPYGMHPALGPTGMCMAGFEGPQAGCVCVVGGSTL